MREVRYKCEKCGHVELTSWKFIILKFLAIFFIVAGMLFVFQMVYMGPSKLVNFYTSDAFTEEAKIYSGDLRNIALNHTTYDGGSAFTFADELVENMPRIRYVRTNRYLGMGTVYDTLMYGGDCKASSILFTTMMMSVGHTAYVDCNVKHRHCVTKIPGREKYNPGKYMVVDLTSDGVYIYNNTVDHWEDKDNVLQRMFYEKKSLNT